MGGGKGASSSQTVSIPPEVLARYNAVNARAENVAQTPFTPYSTSPEAFVAPLSASQQAGIANINAQQGAANQAVGTGQGLQMQGIDTAQRAQAESRGIDLAALQGISQAQQQGTAYNQAAGQNIFNAMGSAAPYMQQNAALQMQGLAQQQAYQRAATQNAANIAASADPYLNQNAALQMQGLGQQQGYQRAATQNIGNAMASASPYMQQMAALTQAGLGQGQQYLGGATDLTQRAIQTGQQYANRAEPFYTGALDAAQPFNRAAQQYMGAGAQAVGPGELNYSQYMNPYMTDVVQAQQALQAQENAQQRAAMRGKAIQSGAFGGDRAGIEQANLARQQNLANQATMANLLQSGYGQAQQMAAQQQGVGLSAAQANRAAQQQAAQQAAALGQQGYAQQLGLGQALAALGQQQYGQALGTGAQIGQLGQQGYTQNLGAGAQLGNVGQQLYAQNIGQGQALANLGVQGLQAMQGTGTNLGTIGMNKAALQGQQAQQLSALGMQGLQAMQGTGTNMGNIGQQLFGQNITQGQAIQGLGQQQFAQGLAGSQAAAGIGQNMYGMGAQTAGLQQAGGMNAANLGLQNQAAQIAAAQAQMAAGQQEQQTEQAGKTALYNQFLQQQGYPFQIAQFLTNTALGTGALSGSTTNATRTGYRGGRMGDGYASGGLVPDSQGGAVFEPGLYGRGGYEDGGAPDYDAMVKQAYAGIGRSGMGSDPSNIDQTGLDYWKGQLQSGAIAPEDFNNQFNQSVQSFVAANPNDPTAQYVSNYQKQAGTAPTTTSGLGAAATTPAATTSTGDNSKYDQIIREAYAGIGRSGIGTNASNIDQAGYNYWLGKLQSGALKPDDFTAQFNKEANAYVAANPNEDVSKVAQPQLGYQAVAGVNKDISAAFKDLTGKDIDAVSARKYQDMLNSGMSLDQIKYNIGQSQPALLKAGDVNALKGQSLAYDPSKFAKPAGVTTNRFGAYSAGDFTPQMPQATGKGAQQPQPYGGYGGGYGNMMGGYGGYGSYGGGYGYGQPSNYGMPNFGSSPQYGGAPDYAGAGLYASNQYNMSQMGGYGMPNYGYGYGMPPQMGGYDQYAQQPPQATGKGAAPSQPQYGYQQPQQPPQATGKGASQAPTASGKGASGMKAGGRAGFALGGVPSMPNPGDPYGTLLAQQAMFAGAPGSSAGYVPPTQSMAGQYKMLTPQASILPEQRSGLKEAVSMGTSIASLGDAGGKLYDKLAKNPTTGVVPDSFSEGMSNFGDKFKNFFGMGNAAGGRIGYNAGGIPGLDDLKQGHADIPGGEGLETPMSKVVEQGTQTPADLKAQMDRMSAGSSGLGGSSGGGLAGALGTASSLASLGSMAFKVGGWMMGLPIFASGGRVGKADGGALVDPSNPRDQAMAEAFDNLLQRYDNNPLLAAAAMDVGTKAVDAAIMKAEQTGGDITDFLPRRTQEYMFALSKAAMGAHDAMNRQERKAGGRTGYKEEGFVDDQPTGLVPAPKPSPSEAMTTGDVLGGLAPQGAGVQVAGPAPAADKGPDYDAIIGRASKETGIPADLLRAQIQQESSFNPNKVGKSGEIGLTQVLSSTAKKPGFGMAGVDPETLRDPEQSIMFGAKYLAARGQAAGVKDWNNPEEVAKGLRAYNGGGDPNYVANVYRHMGLTPPANVGEQRAVQTAGLAPQTKTDAGPFERTFGKAMPDSVPTDSSFWVPLIAGLGTMLASDKYRFSQRLGEGLVGGAAAYGKQQEFGLQKEKVDIERQNNALTMFGKLFQPQYNKNGQLEYLNVRTGEVVSPAEASRLMFGSGAGLGATPPAIGGASTGAGAGAGAGVPAPTTTQSTVAPPAVQPPKTPQKIEIEQKPVLQPSEFKSFEDVDMWARSQPRVVDAQQKADEQQKQISVYQSELDRLPSNALTATRRTELTTLLANARNLEQSYRKEANEQANNLATPYKTQLQKKFEVGLESETPAGTKFVSSPEATLITADKPKEIPADYRAEVNPNTGRVATKPVAEFMGYKETGGHPIDPGLIGKTAIRKSEDKEYTASRERSAKLESEFENGAEKAQDGIATLLKFSTAAKILESGGANMTKAEYANLARGLGFNTLGDQIMSMKDTNAAFMAVKTNVDQAINQVTNSFARPTQAEFLTVEKKSTPSIDMPVDAAHSLTQTRVAGLMWQNALMSDWENAKREGARNFAAFKDAWQRANPHSMFEEAAARALGNFKGQDLPKPDKITEGVPYVVPKNADKSEFGRYLVSQGFRPGDIVVAKGVDHSQKNIGQFVRVNPAEAYKAHISAPAFLYGGQ